ncbi:(2Fe-2S)-binding protein [Burkholderia sp. SRS-W-2-2016]|uniref:(2Fe-2S)-binding protein n=1 Tax=Burkholderia sp. SRS-W-2-2016 TaxID=1926878 RepID=UPI00117D480C|nr:(2Fe-2S)-binding protein [Burkholderia sp. SRS-W-2-2016]
MNRPAQLVLNVNGATHVVSASARTPLLYLLRNDLALNGPKFGCGLGECGACTVLLDGVPTRACVTTAEVALGHEITTLEGLGTRTALHPVQQAFIDEQAAQCGYCLNGMIMTATALLQRDPHPDLATIQRELSRNLCRCGTHVEIVRAVRRAAELLAAQADADAHDGARV